eukprot:1235254-Prymnesium_polylepis.1
MLPRCEYVLGPPGESGSSRGRMGSSDSGMAKPGHRKGWTPNRWQRSSHSASSNAKQARLLVLSLSIVLSSDVARRERCECPASNRSAAFSTLSGSGCHQSGAVARSGSRAVKACCWM